MQMEPSAVVTASLMSGITAIALAIGYFTAEPRSRATRALALTTAAIGLAVATTGPLKLLYESGQPLSWLLRVPIFEGTMSFAAGLWLLSAAQTAQPTPRALFWIRACVWLGWTMALIYFILSLYLPVERIVEYLNCLGRPQGCNTTGFRLFATPNGLLATLFTAGFAILFTQRVDPAERVRAFAVVVASPFLVASYHLPAGYGELGNLVGVLIFMVGAIRYHAIKGEQAQFMSRFLSTEVSKLVRDKGLGHTMQPQSLEITVVCCDLRGFTRLSQLLASDQVIRLLNEYYDAIGTAVAKFGATIKDCAGDGVLILVGAPLPVADHAQKGIALAQRVQEVGKTVIGHWAGPEMKLGIGVGVASGRVTVGAVGSSSRMEYTAVGPAVNLASRLCSQAADGEILVDVRTAELGGNTGLEARGALAVKGIGEVEHFACSSA
jgi:class 3 adenylate cyclase